MARPDVYNIRFSAGKSMKDKLERFAEVLGIEGVAGRMPEIFEKALDQFVDAYLQSLDSKPSAKRELVTA